MKYGLYEDSKNSIIVEKLIDEAISDFIITLKSITKKYRGTGMTDTASREKIALITSDEVFNEL